MQGSLVNFVSEKIEQAAREIEKLEAWRNVNPTHLSVLMEIAEQKLVKQYWKGQKKYLQQIEPANEAMPKRPKEQTYTHGSLGFSPSSPAY
jgi:hypothetical protein